MVVLWFLIYCTLCPLLSITNSKRKYSLPGQPKNVTLKQYSGYIVTDDSYGRSFFYYFVEAQSKRSPTLKPLTLWLGGAHGCSSVGKALFAENGPFRAGKDGKLKRNAYSWNLESNMLYVDSPIGTGFSFSYTQSDYIKFANLTMIVTENMKFIVKWFDKFPKFRNSDFYLGGEGSLGHLVPQLAALVLEYNKNNATPIKLKGLIIGNLGQGTPEKYLGDYLWYHGVISEELYTMLKSVCSAAKADYEVNHGKISKECKKVMAVMDREFGEGLNMDSLLLPYCVTSNSSIKHQVANEDIIGDPCLYDNTMVYLNRPEVQKALHIINTHMPYNWDECNGPLKTIEDAYSTKNFHILSTLLTRHIRILLYSGDQDVAVPVVETRMFAHMIAKDLKLIHMKHNGPWYIGHQIGGWSESYGKLRDGKNITYLTFASVKGGSHFASSTSPSEVFKLFESFLKGSPL